MRGIGKKLLFSGILLIMMAIMAIPAAVSATDYDQVFADLFHLKKGDTLKPGLSEITIPEGWKLKLAAGGYCTQRADEDGDEDDDGNLPVITERVDKDYIITGLSPGGVKAVAVGERDRYGEVCIKDGRNTFYPYKEGAGKTYTWVVTSVVPNEDEISSTVTITGDPDYVPPAKDEYSYYDERMDQKTHKAEDDFGARLESGWYCLTEDRSFDNRMEIWGDAHLILKDGKTLNAKDGIRVVEGCSLHIYGQKESSGKLIATSGNDAAGIGGNKNIASGDIYIHGGTIEARGGDGGAGIGGALNRDGGRIFITGGNITAAGGRGGAGIGGGRGGSNSQITIDQTEHEGYLPRNTYITATGGDGGAGIGGGQNRNGGGSGGTITINSGYEKCTGGKGAAGIGSGDGGEAGNIVINNSNTVPTGGNGGAGIGGGKKGRGGKITIGNAWIDTAIGEGGGAGIGSGLNGQPVDITISNGRIYAQGSAASYGWGNTGQLPSAAIGGGANSRAGRITITGGKRISASIVAVGACVIGHGGGLKDSDYADTAGFTFDFPGSAMDAKSGDGNWISVPVNQRQQVIFSRSSDGSRYLKDRAGLRIDKCRHDKAPIRYDDRGDYKMGEDCDECDTKGMVYLGEHVLLTERITAQGHIRKCVKCDYRTREEKHVPSADGSYCSVCNANLTHFYFKANDSKDAVVKEGPLCTHYYEYALPGPEEVGIEIPEGKVFAGWKYGDGTPYITKRGELYQGNFPYSEELTACWTIPWSSVADRMEQGNSVRLEDDIVCGPEDGPAIVPAGKEVTLDLNGHTIRKVVKGAVEKGHCITVEGSLILTDSSADKKGEITGGTSESAKNLIAGCILVKPGGTFTMEAGNLRGNKAVGSYGGGAVTVDKGTFLMKGGSIIDNKGSRASAVYARGSARVNLAGGDISGNTVNVKDGTDPSWDRGAVYMEDGKSKADRPKILLSGSPQVAGNRDESGRACNVRLAEQTLMGFDLKDSSDRLGTNARIGVHFAKSIFGRIGITDGFRGSMGSFFSDDPSIGIGIRTMDREIVLGEQTSTISFASQPAAPGQSDPGAQGNPDSQGTPAGQGTGSGGETPKDVEIHDKITVVQGESYILPPCTIEPPEGKVFDCWTVRGEEYHPTDSEKNSVEIKGDTVAEPKWRPADPEQQRVIVVSDEHGMAVADQVEQKTGQEVNVLAEPDDGYQLTKLTVEKGNVTLEDDTSQWTSFVMGNQETVIRAQFEPIRVEALEIGPYPGIVKEGESFTLQAEVWPGYAQDIDVSFETMDPDIVHLDFDEYGNPVATARKAGTTKIIITTEKGQGPSKELNVVVGHKALKHVKAVDYTATKDGNIEHWKCGVCGRYYADADGRTEIAKKDTVLTCPDGEKDMYRLDAFCKKYNKAMAKNVKLLSVKGKKAGKVRKAVVKWKKVSGVSGYTVVYSTDKKFRKAVKTKNVKASARKITLKGLKKGKRCYVQVYPYTKVKNAVTGSTYKVYGKGSKKKSVRVK